MADLVEQLKAERVADNSLLHQVVISLSAREDSIVLCVENWDDTVYYIHHVRNRCPDVPIEVIRCGNKKSTMWLRDEVEKRGPVPDRMMFFVDRDLDEYVTPDIMYDSSGLHCTDGYSFENSLVGEQAFDVVWGDLFGLNLRGDIYEHWRARYLDFVREASRMLRLFAAVSIDARRNGGKARLNEIDVKKRYALNADGSYRIIGTLAEAAGGSLVSAVDGRCSKARMVLLEIASIGDYRIARGKNVFWASVYFFSVMRNALTAPSSTVACRRVPEFTANHLLDSLSARLQCPASLHDFIEARAA